MAIGLQELRSSANRITRALDSPVLPVFAALCGVEALLVMALPGMATDAVGAMLGEPVAGLFSSPDSVVRTLGLVALLFAVDLCRTALWAPLRRLVFHDERLTAGDVARAAFRRIWALLWTQQVIGIFVFLVSAVCFLLGLSIQTFPHVLVTFTLAPALYMVVALERPIALSLSTAPRVARRNLLAVYGVQGGLLAMAYWIAEYFQVVEASPMVATWAALSLLITYRFATFFGMSSLFVALEEAGEFE